MKILIPLLLASVLVGGFVIVGCEEQPATKTGPKAGTAPPKICASCGQIKGTADCCKPGATKCEKCGLVKGSPGCCKLPKGTKKDVALCVKCGQIKGSDDCCKADATKCEKCGLAEGSPGCCKIK